MKPACEICGAEVREGLRACAGLSECWKKLASFPQQPPLEPRLRELWVSQSEWSQKTFGTDQERGPIGALKHLEREAKEAWENPSDIVEYADCLLLILDASRRAGFALEALVDAACAKHEVNKGRTWPAPAEGDEPTEHVREGG